MPQTHQSDASHTHCRCGWVNLADPLYVSYHDKEWGVPLFDDRKLFEFIILEGAQAGLSWITVLRKRDHYRAAFHQFDATRIATYTQQDVERLLANSDIIRNRLKINATITNAQAWLALQAEFGSAAEFLWQFVAGKPICNQWQTLSEVPATSPESDAMSKALKKRGFKFIGSTICYAYMQAVGMVNDHTLDCFRHAEVKSI